LRLEPFFFNSAAKHAAEGGFPPGTMEYIVLSNENLLENVLIEIENCLSEGINVNVLAKKYTLSEGHLRRLFRYGYNQTIAGYIRSRKLAVSLDDLLKTELTILDIAIKYGFDYEQSYIRAFKREFGITPGDLRKASKNRRGFI